MPQKDGSTPQETSPQWQKIALAVYLVVATVGVCYLSYITLRKIQDCQTTEVRVDWTIGNKSNLLPGPVEFNYDRKAHSLVYRGSITDDSKRKLLALLADKDPNFDAAIDKLTFDSAKIPSQAPFYVLLLGGLGGILGVKIRSIFDFVGNASHKNALDIARWWPWYIMRPALGFLLGSLVIALTKSDMFLSTATAHGDLGWLSLATLAGFGSDDVMSRLRLMSKTLFGEDGNKISPPKAPNAENDDKSAEGGSTSPTLPSNSADPAGNAAGEATVDARLLKDGAANAATARLAQ